MIKHTVIMRFRHDYKHVGMMGVRKYIGGDFSGISEAIYELKWYEKMYYKFKHKKAVKYQTAIYCDPDKAEEFIAKLNEYNIDAVHRAIKSYKVFKSKLLLEEHEMVMLKLIG